MNVYVSTDLEGVSGVVDYDDHQYKTLESFSNIKTARKLLIYEVNAAVEGASLFGASKILVNDSHGFGMNIVIEGLHPKAELICGRGKSSWLPLIDTGFDALLLVGFHSKAGTTGGMLSHTYSRRISDVELNGCSVGEIGICAAIAGSFDIPTIFISGDSSAVHEAMEIVPNIESVEVKESLSNFHAKCLSPPEAHERIRNGVQRALSRITEIKPYKIAPPFVLVVKYSKPFLPFLRLFYKRKFKGIKLKGLSSLEIRDKDLGKVWQRFY